MELGEGLRSGGQLGLRHEFHANGEDERFLRSISACTVQCIHHTVRCPIRADRTDPFLMQECHELESAPAVGADSCAT